MKIHNAETIQSYFTRISQIKEQIEAVKEEVKNAKVVIATLNGPLGSWDSFIWGMCARRKWLLLTDSRKSTHKTSSTHNKRKEDGSNWRSSFHHLNKIPQAMRIWRTQHLKNLLSILAFGYEMMNEEDDEAEGSRRSLPTKQIKISIQLSFHDIVLIMHLFIFSWCIMHDRMFALMKIYY